MRKLSLSCPNCNSTHIEHVWEDIIYIDSQINVSFETKQEATQFSDNYDFYCINCGHYDVVSEFKK